MTLFQPSDQVGVSCSQVRSDEGNSWCGLGCSVTSSRAQTLSTIPLDSLLQPLSSRCFQSQVVTVSVNHPFPVQERGPHHVALHIRSKSDQRLPRDAYWNFMKFNLSIVSLISWTIRVLFRTILTFVYMLRHTPSHFL